MSIISLLVWVIVICLICWLVIFIMNQLGVGHPWRTIIMVAGAIILIVVLLSVIGVISVPVHL